MDRGNNVDRRSGSSMFRNAIYRDGVLDLHHHRQPGRLSLPRRLNVKERLRSGMFGNRKRSKPVSRPMEKAEITLDNRHLGGQRRHSTSRLIDAFFMRNGIRRRHNHDDDDAENYNYEDDNDKLVNDVAMRSHFLLGNAEPRTAEEPEKFSIAELVEREDRHLAKVRQREESQLEEKRRMPNEDTSFSSNWSNVALITSPDKGGDGGMAAYQMAFTNVDYATEEYEKDFDDFVALDKLETRDTNY